MRDLKNLVVRGSAWNLAASFVRYGFDLVVNIVLVRLLLPSDFGLVAMATSFAAFVAIFGQVGLSSALVQQKDIGEAHLSSVFWISAALGLVIGALVAASSPLIAMFYDEPAVMPLTIVLALQFPISSFAVVPRARLTRELRFGVLARLDILSAAVAGVLAIVLAALGADTWSIVLRMLAMQTLATALVWPLAGWRPRARFDWPATKQLLRFSINYYAAEIVRFASRNIDTILVGKLLGAAPLGVYNRGYALMMMPMKSLSQPLSSVAFSAFSAIQDDHQRIRSIYLRFTGALAIAIFPAMLGLFATAEPAVLGVFGEPWVELVDVVRILSPAAAWQGVLGMHKTLFTSTGRTDLQLRYTIIGRALVIVGIAVGLPWGIVGVAVGFSAGSLLDTMLGVHSAGRVVGLSSWAVVSHLKGVIFAALVMTITIIGLDQLSTIRALPHLARLGVLVAVGAPLYGALVVVIKPAPYHDLRDVLASYRRKGQVTGSRGAPSEPGDTR